MDYKRDYSQEHCSSHIIYEKIPCFITGRLVDDTDRERIRQKLAKYMVEELGYSLADFSVDRTIEIEVFQQRVRSFVDISVVIDGKTLMILRGGPGSVVTRESGTISCARLLEKDYIVPYAVQANLIDAAILDVRRKKAISYGWENIPTKKELIEMTINWPPPSLPEKRIPIEKQILFSYDTHG